MLEQLSANKYFICNNLVSYTQSAGNLKRFLATTKDSLFKNLTFVSSCLPKGVKFKTSTARSLAAEPLPTFWSEVALLSTKAKVNNKANNYLKNKSSSETTSEISRNFEMFNKHTHKKVCYNWLTWFIGFTEGDGAILNNKVSPRFVLTQKEGTILYHVQEVLGFGIVKKFENFYRFIVTEPQEIVLLAYLFNGNLVLPHRLNQMSE